MRIWFVGLLVLSVGLLGCSRESNRGGPGAKDTKPTTTSSTDNQGSKTTTTETTKTNTPNDNAQTFTIKVPSGGTNVTQGANQTVTVSISRGKDFHQPVKLKFDAPAGVKISPVDPIIREDTANNSVKVTIDVDPTVSEGRHKITVTGEPETGAAAKVDMDIDVKKKG